jgi:hypothetical protein
LTASFEEFDASLWVSTAYPQAPRDIPHTFLLKASYLAKESLIAYSEGLGKPRFRLKLLKFPVNIS